MCAAARPGAGGSAEGITLEPRIFAAPGSLNCKVCCNERRLECNGSLAQRYSDTRFTFPDSLRFLFSKGRVRIQCESLAGVPWVLQFGGRRSSVAKNFSDRACT